MYINHLNSRYHSQIFYFSSWTKTRSLKLPAMGCLVRFAGYFQALSVSALPLSLSFAGGCSAIGFELQQCALRLDAPRLGLSTNSEFFEAGLELH